MRHYESLNEALEDLREPNNVEIEGVMDMVGTKFYVSGKTLSTDFEGERKEMYKLWIEEIHNIKEVEGRLEFQKIQ